MALVVITSTIRVIAFSFLYGECRAFTSTDISGWVLGLLEVYSVDKYPQLLPQWMYIAYLNRSQISLG